MGAPLVLRFIDRGALEREYHENLAHGRAFVAEAVGVAPFSTCVLHIEHPETGSTLEVESEVVMVVADGPVRGIALQFKRRGQQELARLADFVAERASNDDSTAFGEDLTGFSESAANDAGQSLDVDLADFAERADAEEGALHTDLRKLVYDRQQRLRNLSLSDRLKVARGPNMDDRILLERIYGSAVWEPLLRNPKITVPEVARLAKKGTLPRPLLELITENEGWIRKSLVRRALLTNPRLSSEAAARVLRTMPPRELKLVPQQTAYPATVRATATRLLRGA